VYKFTTFKMIINFFAKNLFRCCTQEKQLFLFLNDFCVQKRGCQIRTLLQLENTALCSNYFYCYFRSRMVHYFQLKSINQKSGCRCCIVEKKVLGISETSPKKEAQYLFIGALKQFSDVSKAIIFPF